ncbi:exodeoxyribonuclease III [Candidatus Saccharibacteria bacterium]|nr:exodeoxyribonuclease III [Candidatus Saccharibacteria bacterium]
MKLFSWNINGLRAVLRKGALQEFVKKEQPDILCLQEIKCKPGQLSPIDTLELSESYDLFWNPADRSGYSGTMTMVKKEKFPNYETFEKGLFTDEEMLIASTEGRILTTEFPNFFLVNVYTPNSKPDLSRLSLREQTWDPSFKNYLKKLESHKKPVITCGDFNAAHEEIDLARPDTNHKNAGFTDEERQGITNLLADGFIDTFRLEHPTSKRYSWWSHWGKARENNVGWRIDYFFISESLKKNLKSAEIYENYLGSDHCPVSIELEI